MQEVGIVGLGKLGLPMAVCLAEGGLKVIGVDLRRITNSPEPGVNKLMEKHLANGSLVISDDYSTLPEDVIVLVNTPEVKGSFSTCQIESVLEKLDDKFIILSSTVSPGSCERLGVDAYVPDFVALGNVVKDFQNPSIFMVGSNEPHKAYRAAAILSRMHIHDIKPNVLSFSDAEYAKIFLNNYIALKISYANLISEYTDDPIEVCNALGGDPRIGKAYFKPGLPWGGQCFPRDVYVLSNMGAHLGDMGTLIDNINESCYARLLEKVKTQAVGRVLILGLAFKEDTDCTDNSPGAWLLKELEDAVGYDPCVTPELSLNEEIKKANTIVIMHRRYSHIILENKIIINPWESP